MNTLTLVLGSALVASGLAVSVVITTRTDGPASSDLSELTRLTHRLVQQQDVMMRNQEFFRLSVIEMVEAQEKLLHLTKMEAEKVQGQVEQSDQFFEKNMGIGFGKN